MKLKHFFPSFVLLIISFNSVSQEMNFDEIDFYKDSIIEIMHFEVQHYFKLNDTNLLNHYIYNVKGQLIEKRYNYRITQNRRKSLDDVDDKFLYLDTVGTKENSAFTTIKYKYNENGFLISKKYINSEPIFVLDGLYIENTLVSKCKYFNENGLHVSSVLSYQDGTIETEYYQYSNELMTCKRTYRNEKLRESIIFKYKFYNEK